MIQCDCFPSGWFCNSQFRSSLSIHLKQFFFLFQFFSLCGMAVLCNCFIMGFGYFSIEVLSTFTDKLEFISYSCLEFLLLKRMRFFQKFLHFLWCIWWYFLVIFTIMQYFKQTVWIISVWRGKRLLKLTV